MAEVARVSPMPRSRIAAMESTPAPRRLEMDGAASSMNASPEIHGDDAATLELVWRLQ